MRLESMASYGRQSRSFASPAPEVSRSSLGHIVANIEVFKRGADFVVR